MTGFDWELSAIIWCMIAMWLGGLIKGTLGVGTPLLTVPMMAMVLPAQLAVTMMVIPVVVANLWQIREAEQPRQIVNKFWPAFIALFVGASIGVTILAGINERNLLILVGVLVILFTLLQGSQFKIQLPAHLQKISGVAFGFCSGIVGGLSSMFGPILVLYLVSIGGLNKNQFVSSISFLYVAAVCSWAVILGYNGLLSWHLLVSSTVAVLPLSVGLWIGRNLRNKIDEKQYHHAILLILLASGSSMLWRAWSMDSMV